MTTTTKVSKKKVQKEKVVPTIDVSVKKEINKAKLEITKESFMDFLVKANHFITAKDIQNFIISPKHYYYHKYENVIKTERYQIGEAIKDYLESPHAYDARYAFYPKVDRRTNAGKATIDIFELENEGKFLLQENEYRMIESVAKEIKNDKHLTKIIQESISGVSYYTVDDRTGLNIKLRPDLYNEKMQTSILIKELANINERSHNILSPFDSNHFIEHNFNSNYLNIENSYTLLIENIPPYSKGLFDFENKKQYLYNDIMDMLLWSNVNDYWCDCNEFNLLKDCQKNGNLDNFFEVKQKKGLLSIPYRQIY